MSVFDNKLINYGNLAEFHSKIIDDSSVSNLATWSSQLINNELADKQDVLTAGAGIDISNGVISATGGGGGGSATIENITYAQLKAKRDNGQLVKGQQYRITDYVTMANSDTTPVSSAEHPFDLIVTAIDTSILSETGVKVAHCANDDYFIAQPLRYYIDEGDANMRPYKGTIEIDGTTYYKWYGEDSGGGSARMYILTTQSSYSNSSDGEDENGEYYYTSYPIAGFLNEDEDEMISTYEPWERKHKCIIKTEDVDGTMYLLIGDIFLASSETYQTSYEPKLEAWEAKYCLDNDKSRFDWVQEGDEGTLLPAMQVMTEPIAPTHYKWAGLNKNYYEVYYLTSQSSYTNTLIDDSYYTTAYNLDGVITRDGEPTDGLYKDKKILYTNDNKIYLGDEHTYGDGKYTGDYDYVGTYAGTYEEVVYSKYIYIRYPEGDANGQYAWAYVNNSENKELNDFKTPDFEDIDTADLIYTPDTTPVIGEVLDMGGVNVTITQLTDNAGYIPQGKGVIYYLKDEFNNEAEYDFKNILFKQDFWAIQASDGDSRIYKRYPEGDDIDKYAFAYINGSDEYTIEAVENNPYMWSNIATNVILYFYNSMPSTGDYDENNEFEVIDSKMISLGYKFTFGEASDEPIDDTFNGNSNNNNIESKIIDEIRYIPVLNLQSETVDYGKGGGTTYEAGSNIQIDGNVISATDTTYGAGRWITIKNNVITCVTPQATKNNEGTVRIGDGLDINNGIVSLPTANASTLGGIKVGDGLSISNEVLSTIVTPELLIKLLLNPDLLNPLTFEAIEDNTEITFKGSNINIETSKDGKHWTQYSASTSGTLVGTLNTAEQLFVRGENSSYDGRTFEFSKNTYVYGNIMSLINKNNYPVIYKLTANRAFALLFTNNTHLLSHQTRKLCLPATTLTDSCYLYMFLGCRSLTTAPELPATTLASECYSFMFDGCSSLVNAPELPATTLAYECCYYMFDGCSSLVNAPELPATTLASKCYGHMFNGCSSLTSAPELPATTLTGSCYLYMFDGCSSLVNAPELPATTLAYGCYSGMFSRCTNLNYIKCLATDISALYCTDQWLYLTSSTGTFITPQSTNWTTGNSGIPSGWTRVDA